MSYISFFRETPSSPSKSNVYYTYRKDVGKHITDDCRAILLLLSFFFFLSCCRRRDRSSTSAKCGGGTFISVNIFSHPARCLGDVAAFFIPAPQLLFRPTVSSAREEQRHLSFLPIGTRPFPKSSRGRGRKRRKKENVVGLSLVGRMQHPSRSFRYGGYTERHRRDRAGCRYV